MAIFSLRAKTFSRGAGQSAVAVAAYRSGERLIDERTSQIKDYSAGQGRVVFSQVMIPAEAPARFRSRHFLWNEVERFEVRSDARLAREMMVALPHELTDQQREWLVREFVRETLTRRGYAADVNIHKPTGGDARNYHCHILFTDRQIGPDGFKELKDRALNSKAQLEHWRERWAALTNRYLERFGHEARVDHRSLVAQGIDREPTIHLGPIASEMIARGAVSDRGALQAEILAHNALCGQIDIDDATLAGLQLRVANENRLQVAIRDQNVTDVIDLLTHRRPTFGNRDLARFLARSIPHPEDRADFGAAVLAHPSIVPLATTPEGRVTRFTTRTILSHEQQVLRTANTMVQSRRHRLPWGVISSVMRRPEFASISGEQVDALAHLARADQLGILIGRAGTGKSYTLSVLRQAYEAQKFTVVGLAFTNKVAQNLARDGFRGATTIHSELRALELGSRSWNARTVVVVDEAAMLSTELLGKLIEQANKAGAALRLAGDDRQLPSIDRGGLFTELVKRHGAARLQTVLRQHDEQERQASQLLGEGKFAEALAIYEQRQAIRWSDTQDQAMADLVAQWTTDRAAHPEASRLVIAYTNADVDRLNAALRQAARASDLQAGLRQEDTWLNTSRGSEPYAMGDRLVLTGNDRKAGLFNGQFGTIEDVSPERIVLRLDGQREPVSFDPRVYSHFRHGFAATIHKVQGETVDRPMVYHTKHWRAESAYVALTRHREALQVFVARETAGDLDQLTKLLSRSDAQQAASGFPEATSLPTRPVSAAERQRATSQPPTSAADQRPALGPTVGQGDGRRTETPPAPRREDARAAGPASGTTQPTRERWRMRADGSFERIDGSTVPSAEQDGPRAPMPPPRQPGVDPASAAVPAAPADAAAAARRGLQRDDLLPVRQVRRTTREQVAAHLALARDPAANLGAWLALDPPQSAAPQIQPAAERDQAAEPAPDQANGPRVGPRSAVDDWAEQPGYVPQTQSATRALSRLRGTRHLKAGPKTTREIVRDHLALARDPLSDLPAWLDLAPPNPAFLPPQAQQPAHGPQVADSPTGNSQPVRGDALPEVRLRMDADRGGGLDLDRVSGGPAAGAGRPQDMQPVRGGGSGQPGELKPPADLASPQPPFQPLPLPPPLSITLTYGAASMSGLALPPHAPGAPSRPPQAPPEPTQPGTSVPARPSPAQPVPPSQAAPAAPASPSTPAAPATTAAPAAVVPALPLSPAPAPHLPIHPTLPRPVTQAAPSSAAAQPTEIAPRVEVPALPTVAASSQSGTFQAIPAPDHRPNQMRDEITDRAAAERAIEERLFGKRPVPDAPRFVVPSRLPQAPPAPMAAPAAAGPAKRDTDRIAAAAREHTVPRPPVPPVSPAPTASPSPAATPAAVPAAAVPAAASASAAETPAQGAFTFPTQPAPPPAAPSLDPVTAAMLAALAQQTAALKEIMERPAASPAPAAAAPAVAAAAPTQQPGPARPQPAPNPAAPAGAADRQPEQPRNPEDEFRVQLPSGKTRPMTDPERLVYEYLKRTGKLGTKDEEGSQAEAKGPTLSMGGRAPPR